MLKHLIRQLLIFIVHGEKTYKMLSERKKERLKGAIKQALLQNQKVLLEGLVLSLIGKCTALYVVKNAKIKKPIEDVKHITILKMCENREDVEALALKRRIMIC